MANIGEAHVTIHWDTDPSEKAKDFVRKEVLTTLKECLSGTWLTEIVQAEVQRVLAEKAKDHG